MSRPRLFIGFPVSNSIRQKVDTLPGAWGSVGQSVAWSPMEELHVTVLFLGEVPTTDWMTVCKCVEGVTAETMTFDVHLHGLGAFPNLRRPRVVYAGVGVGAAELTGLHNAIADRLTEKGYFVREERGYTPHLTVGRITSDENHEAIAQELVKFAEWDGGKLTVGELTIYSSEQRRGRYEYTVVGRYPLDG
jgi:RNA 2',3'-cyclic 3'-phosphodiesterase